MKSRGLPLILCLWFFSTFNPAPALSAGGFWLHIESRVDSTFLCQGSESETLIFHDGLVTRKSVSQDGVKTFTRMMASPDTVRRLADALGRNKVGTALGGCAVNFGQPNDSFEFTITWFGKPGRTHTISVTSPSGEPCPERTNAIFAAIEEFIRAASTAPGAEQVELTFDPGPPCGKV